MNAKQLKDSILQYAMQGKLVPQNQNDEPASELLKRIAEEKQRLIKEGVIKKEKPLPPISEEEIPFDIPDSWEWVRIKDIYYNLGQKKPDEIFCYIDVSTIDNIKGILKEGYQVLKPENAPSRARKIVHAGDIIYSTVRPYLQNIAIISGEHEHETIASTAFIVMKPILVDIKFLYHVLRSPFFNFNVESKMQGATYPAINDTNFNSLVIPIPPINEQKLIVSKIEELLNRVNNYHDTYVKLSSIKKEFPNNLEKSILQYAMQGKLVEQAPNDEPAQLLVEKIRVEKERLVKGKLIKKEKPLPPITEEEIPFDIPSSWEWVRLGDVANVTSGSTPLKSNVDYYQNGTIPWCTSTVTGLEIVNEPTDFITEKALKECSLSVYPKGTLIMAMYGQGKTRGQVTEINFDSAINQACAAIETINKDSIQKDYLRICLSYVYNSIREKSAGGAQPNLNLFKVKSILIPVPPLKEQERIVAAVEKMMVVKNKLI